MYMLTLTSMSCLFSQYAVRKISRLDLPNRMPLFMPCQCLQLSLMILSSVFPVLVGCRQVRINRLLHKNIYSHNSYTWISYGLLESPETPVISGMIDTIRISATRCQGCRRSVVNFWLRPNVRLPVYNNSMGYRVTEEKSGLNNHGY